MKTLAQLKRDAKEGKLFAEMILRQGTADIPERLKGIRQIVDANSVGIKFLNNDGKTSELRIECASLVEYDEDYIIIYSAGLRDLSPEEQVIINKWEQENSDNFYHKKRFFTESGFEYLLGYDKVRGKKYDYYTKKVQDNSIKGEASMKYKLIKAV